MAYTWEEIKFLGNEWWKSVPFKDKARGALPAVWGIVTTFGSRGVPMFALTAIKAARLAGLSGLGALNLNFWMTNLQVAIGWVIGWQLADLDRIFYAISCDSKDETCQRVKREIDLKRWKSAWRILEATSGEQERLPIRNVVTLIVIGLMGVWVMTSSLSVVALSLVFGLGTRLLIEVWTIHNFQKWYWIFKRDFEWVEHRILLVIASGIFLYQAFGIIRL